MTNSTIECPSCHSNDVHACGKRYALYPVGPLAIFGIALAAIHQASAPFDYHCKACGGNFAHRTKLARLARGIWLLLFWWCVIAFSAGLLLVLFRR